MVSLHVAVSDCGGAGSVEVVRAALDLPRASANAGIEPVDAAGDRARRATVSGGPSGDVGAGSAAGRLAAGLDASAPRVARPTSQPASLAIHSSTASGVRGIAAESRIDDVSVTTRSSSIRMPRPRSSAGTVRSPGWK